MKNNQPILKTVLSDKKELPFIIAEMSGNHKHSLDRALQIVDSAAEAGVSAVKIQTYTADTMTIDSEKEGFVIKDSNSLWNGRKLYDLYKDASTPWEWHKAIFERCKQKGIIGFSTPYDATAVDFLESLNVPLYKIASFEMVDLPLIKKVAMTKKPVIISTGMATVEEIGEAVDCARNNGSPEVIILKCTSAYPSDPKYSNLLTIPDMAGKFGCAVGISDHTLGIGAALAAVGLGAQVIEKHITVSRNDGGIDSPFSLEPQEMKSLVEESRRAYEALGAISYGPTEKDKRSLVFRRSLYAIRDIKKGEVFSVENIRAIRPGLGISPKYYENILLKKSLRDISRGEPISWPMVEGGL